MIHVSRHFLKLFVNTRNLSHKPSHLIPTFHSNIVDLSMQQQEQYNQDAIQDGEGYGGLNYQPIEVLEVRFSSLFESNETSSKSSHVLTFISPNTGT